MPDFVAPVVIGVLLLIPFVFFLFYAFPVLLAWNDREPVERVTAALITAGVAIELLWLAPRVGTFLQGS